MSLQPPLRPDDQDDVDDRYADTRIDQHSRPWVGYVAVMVSVAYVVLGIIIGLVPPGKLVLPRPVQLVFAAMLVVYGTWRVVRTRNKYFR